MSDGKSKSHLDNPQQALIMAKADFKQIREAQAARNALSAAKKGSKGSSHSTQRESASDKASLTENFDTELYGRNGGDKYAGYNTTIAANDDDVDMADANGDDGRRLIGQYTATTEQMNEFARGDMEEEDPLLAKQKEQQIASRESSYQKRRFDRQLSPARADPFAANGSQNEGKTYREVMAEREMDEEEARVKKMIADKQSNGEDTVKEHKATLTNGESDDKDNKEAQATTGKKRKSRWGDGGSAVTEASNVETSTTKKSRWDATAAVGGDAPQKKPGRWDIAPSLSGDQQGLNSTANQAQSFGNDIRAPASSISDDELDMLLPTEGYKIVDPPPGYQQMVVPGHRSTAASTSSVMGGFMMQESVDPKSMGKSLPDEIPGVGQLQQGLSAEDMEHFGTLLDDTDEATLGVDELKKRKVKRLLLKIMRGTPSSRKQALRSLTDNARQLGPGPIFDTLLPIMFGKTLDDSTRHLLFKALGRVLYKLDDLCRPYTHRILVVSEPLLLDISSTTRQEGREVISQLAKAVGLATIISVMRADIDQTDEFVRNVTSRAFAVVASGLGIPALLPFFKAVCRSKKSWMARNTGCRIVQQVAILVGSGVLPHLKTLVDIVTPCLQDEQLKVRTTCGLALAALAEAAYPYGIESFDGVLAPLWTGARKQRGKGLAAFLRCIAMLIPLMSEDHATYYTSQIMPILIREFSSPDDEMRKVVLKAISQCAKTEGVTGSYLKETVLNDFFKNFWVRRMAGDQRNYRQVVDTTVDLGQKVGAGEIVERVVHNLKDETEPFRKLTMEVVEKLIASLGAADIGERLEERLIDGVLHAFQDQTTEDIVMLNGFGTVVNALGVRTKPYFPQIASTCLFRLNNKTASVRQQAADLISRLCIQLRACEEDVLMSKLGQVLYEYLGEEYPEVLGSILGALRSLVSVVGINTMKPPIKDLLPRLTPILRNRHEKVQENAVDLIGRIADRGPESVNAKEWMRIVFELLDMLKAHKKGIRRAANNTFGYIAKAIGPQDVLATLLNNLRVQERQSRVCTAVAIGIVAETCAPFTVLPALMNEYRVPELNVQNGVLKAISFLAEYIGEMNMSYVYSIVPILEDSLTDRDQVHRQTAAAAVTHLALGVVGLGCEDAMVHLLNLLWPNIFETSPHVIDRIIEAINAIRMAVGMGPVMNYVWAGLFHPARKVRTPYWRLYNDAYVGPGGSDAMVPYYPMVEELGIRHELLISL